MDTKQYKYRVIWADDDIFDLVPDEDIETLLEDYNVAVIDRVTTGEELQDSAHKYANLIDAIIVDANFDARNKSATDRTVTGLNRAFELYREFKRNKIDIPFYLYTNRTDQFLFEDKDEDYSSSINEIFVETGRVFKKSDGYYDLLALMKQEVDEKTSPIYQLRRRYAAEFSAAELIPEALDLLIQGLLFQFDEKANYTDTQYYFNPARMIWEKIQSLCKKNDILPQISQLNSMADFLMGNKVEGFVRTEEIMPAPLAHSLKYFLSVTQDGSHTKDDLSLGVVNYVRERKNVNLYRTILYITMDLLLWYKETIESDKRHLWKAEYILIGEAKLKLVKGDKGFNKKCYYLGRYYLIAHRDEQGNMIPINEGDLIGIKSDKNSKPNNLEFTGEDGTVVDKAIYDYVILGKKE